MPRWGRDQQTLGVGVKIILLALLALLPGAVLAADAGTIKEDTTLRTAPAGEAVAPLREGVLVEVGQRDGGWYQVTLTDGRSGWVRLMDVRLDEQGEEDSLFGGLWSWLNSGPQRTHSGTTTAGIRGLSAEDIQSSGNREPQTVDDIRAFRVDADDARKFAASHGLESHTVAELED